ncbi:hypothetical protein [Streptomyces sp. NPDC057438]|uniref:HoxN/HupN/NixA family nickel/cobalt transporter n=1 Tax=Streptomyces sp. NPDC057438 TaxID=3346133 RepID=UPI0036CAA79B
MPGHRPARRGSLTPDRKRCTRTSPSPVAVAVALVIGTVELLGLVADKAGPHGPFRDGVAGLDLNVAGYAVVGLFLVTWAVALLVWRFARIEEKRTTGRPPTPGAPGLTCDPPADRRTHDASARPRRIDDGPRPAHTSVPSHGQRLAGRRAGSAPAVGAATRPRPRADHPAEAPSARRADRGHPASVAAGIAETTTRP